MTNQEINKAVARNLGWTKIQNKIRNGHKSDQLEGIRFYPGAQCPMFTDIPNYASDIKAAWEVVEWMQKNMPEEILRLECVGNEWNFGPTMICGEEEFIADSTNGRADTAPMAICLAFLRQEI